MCFWYLTHSGINTEVHRQSILTTKELCRDLPNINPLFGLIWLLLPTVCATLRDTGQLPVITVHLHSI